MCVNALPNSSALVVRLWIVSIIQAKSNIWVDESPLQETTVINEDYVAAANFYA